MTQTTIDFERAEQPRQLARVGSKTQSHILHFVALHKQFHINEMVAYVEAQGVRIAPASCDRILRMLRQERRLNYRVLNRRASLYETLPIARQP